MGCVLPCQFWNLKADTLDSCAPTCKKRSNYFKGKATFTSGHFIRRITSSVQMTLRRKSWAGISNVDIFYHVRKGKKHLSYRQHLLFTKRHVVKLM